MKRKIRQILSLLLALALCLAPLSALAEVILEPEPSEADDPSGSAPAQEEGSLPEDLEDNPGGETPSQEVEAGAAVHWADAGSPHPAAADTYPAASTAEELKELIESGAYRDIVLTADLEVTDDMEIAAARPVLVHMGEYSLINRAVLTIRGPVTLEGPGVDKPLFFQEYDAANDAETYLNGVQITATGDGATAVLLDGDLYATEFVFQGGFASVTVTGENSTAVECTGDALFFGLFVEALGEGSVGIHAGGALELAGCRVEAGESALVSDNGFVMVEGCTILPWEDSYTEPFYILIEEVNPEDGWIPVIPVLMGERVNSLTMNYSAIWISANGLGGITANFDMYWPDDLSGENPGIYQVTGSADTPSKLPIPELYDCPITAIVTYEGDSAFYITGSFMSSSLVLGIYPQMSISPPGYVLLWISEDLGETWTSRQVLAGNGVGGTVLQTVPVPDDLEVGKEYWFSVQLMEEDGSGETVNTLRVVVTEEGSRWDFGGDRNGTDRNPGNNGGEGGSRTSSGGGSSFSDRSTLDSQRGGSAAAPVENPLTTAEVKSALDKAVLEQGGNRIALNFHSKTSITLEELQAIAKLAEESGYNVILHMDTVLLGTVLARFYIDPALASGGIQLGLSAATDTKALFEKYYSNNLMVYRLAHTGEYGMSVHIAVKADLTGLDTAQLVFYTYDRSTNQYRLIAAPDWRIDKNGYLHFMTDRGGDVIISEGRLTQ